MEPVEPLAIPETLTLHGLSEDAQCSILNACVYRCVLPVRRDYARNMHDAWTLLDRFIPTDTNFYYKIYPETTRRFVDALLDASGTYSDDEIYPASFMFSYIRTWTPKMLTISAVQAVGVTIE